MKKNIVIITWTIISLLVFFLLAYLLIFGRALRQPEKHLAIFFACPRVFLSSEAVQIDDQKYLARNVTAFIKTIEAEGFTFIDQMGSGYFLEKDEVSYLSTSRMYSSYFMIFTAPAAVKKVLPVSTTNRPIRVNSEWLKIYQAISDCQLISIMRTHSRIISAELKDGRRLEATESDSDDIMKYVVEMEKKCGRIIMATE